MRKNKTDKLNEHTALKTKNCMLRTESAIEKMIELSIPINFQSVSRHAAVAKSWLYKQHNIANKIKELRCINNLTNKDVDLFKSLNQRNNIIKKLSDELSDLKNTNYNLEKQIEALYGEILTMRS